jgi:hypothetical protein
MREKWKGLRPAMSASAATSLTAETNHGFPFGPNVQFQALILACQRRLGVNLVVLTVTALTSVLPRQVDHFRTRLRIIPQKGSPGLRDGSAARAVR